MHIYWYKEYAEAQLIKALRLAGSIPADVIGFFIELIVPAHTMVLGSTQPLTEKSTRNISCGRCVVYTTLLPSCADCPEILQASTSWSPQGLSRPV
jgi:hypothetical protein